MIFDLGDVLVDLDKGAVPRALENYGFPESDAALQRTCMAYEIGALTTEVFLKELSDALKEEDQVVLTGHWNATIGDFPEGRLRFLEHLRQSRRYKMYLLSNTNALHIDCLRGKMGSAAYGRLRACFDGFYLSHEVGMRKPEKRLFRHVLEINGLDPAETLFIDDTGEHIRSAATLGIATWHLQVGEEDVRDLQNRL